MDERRALRPPLAIPLQPSVPPSCRSPVMARATPVVLALLVLAAPARCAEPGADKVLDDAVSHALEYLHNSQDKTDGAWRAQGQVKSAAVTALCVMAFLSAGHVPGEGP